MCGVAGVHSLTGTEVPKLNTFIDVLLAGIANRGSDATGLLALYADGEVKLQRQLVPARRFIPARDPVTGSPRSVLLHTRFATVGSPQRLRNAHPIGVGDTYAVHNGTIWNAARLFETFGLTRAAEVDSEIVPALLELSAWGGLHEVLALLGGSAALATVTAARPADLLLARTKSSPLVFTMVGDFIAWASTAEALTRACHEVWTVNPVIERLSDGEFLHLRDGDPTFGKFTPHDRPREIARTERLPGTSLPRLDELAIATRYVEPDEEWTGWEEFDDGDLFDAMSFCDSCGDDFATLTVFHESHLCTSCLAEVLEEEAAS